VAKVLERIGVPQATAFVPDPFQVEAVAALESADVLVTAPTGSGKTYIAIKAIEQVHAGGGHSWYASPLKALSNAKYEEFTEIFGARHVGIVTGDRKENVNAPILVGTTEILRNQLYDAMHRGEDLPVDLVVLDEAHYLGDPDRGVVWEEVLIYLPARIRVLLLSATIQNGDELCAWLFWLRHSPCRLIASEERPVPLFPLFLLPSCELVPLATRRGLFAKIAALDRKSFSKREFPDIPHLLEVLRNANLLPAIFFLKSRADCEKAITMCPPAPQIQVSAQGVKAFRRRLEELLRRYPFLRRHQHLGILRNARVGAHHAGQLPHWKLMLEKLMQQGSLEAIFATSTVAAGVNFPARTVVILQSDRFNGRDFIDLTATDLLQMTGRAGRRGMDEIGFVLIVPGPYQDAQLIHDLLRSPPDPIHSQIRVNFSMVLNLLLSHNPEEIRNLFARCLATYQNLRHQAPVMEDVEALRAELATWLPETACGTLAALAAARPQYAVLRERLRKLQKQVRQGASQGALRGRLVAGRLFLDHRGSRFVLLEAVGEEATCAHAVKLRPGMERGEGDIVPRTVELQRIHALGPCLEEVPALGDRQGWQALAAQAQTEPFRPVSRKAARKMLQPSAATDDLQWFTVSMRRMEELPCSRCALLGPCQKSERHPWSRLLHRYFAHLAQVRTVQDQLWRSFLHHFHFLQAEGYVDGEGRLTDDGRWASQLRLDQPLLISEGIRRGAFPNDHPALLAALIAPFVMDRERAGELEASSLAFKYPDLAHSFFQLMHALASLRERLEEAGFALPPLHFWTTVIVFQWACGHPWEELRTLSGMDEGDLAMVVLRTADHLRQIESLEDTHPRLATCARTAITLLLRPPVLVA
jgi:superfamily II RNA helicase